MYYYCTRETHQLLNPPLLNPPFVNSRPFARPFSGPGGGGLAAGLAPLCSTPRTAIAVRRASRLPRGRPSCVGLPDGYRTAFHMYHMLHHTIIQHK